MAPISGQCRWSCTPTRPRCLSDTRRKSWKPQSGCTHPAKDGQGAEGPTSQGGKPCEEPQKQWKERPHLNGCWGQSFLSLAKQISLVICMLAQHAVTTRGAFINVLACAGLLRGCNDCVPGTPCAQSPGRAHRDRGSWRGTSREARLTWTRFWLLVTEQNLLKARATKC